MYSDNVVFLRPNKRLAGYAIAVAVSVAANGHTRTEAEYFIDCLYGINCY